MKSTVCVVGVGMIPFVKPGTSDTYDCMGARAVRLALEDAGLVYDDMQQIYAGWVYADSTAGQRALYKVGMSGAPIINVNNNCSTGASALYLARQAVQSGVIDCALAVGFEQMTPGALGMVFEDRPSPLEKFLEVVDEQYEGASGIPLAIRLFGAAGLEYQERYGVNNTVFAKVRAKASRHAVNNELALFRRELTEEEILSSPKMFLNLTRLQCCPPTCGAAAAIVCSQEFARRRGLPENIVIRSQTLKTDFQSTFSDRSAIKAVGSEMSAIASKEAYEIAGVGPEDIDLVELHDCFTVNEVLSYESLGFCPPGCAAQFIDDGDSTYGGAVVVNPSGGLLSKGHPLGATGLAQCAELVWQLRGAAGSRQVHGARLGLQHNVGLGGACVVTLFERVN